jgi:hypothetical protein
LCSSHTRADARLSAKQENGNLCSTRCTRLSLPSRLLSRKLGQFPRQLLVLYTTTVNIGPVFLSAMKVAVLQKKPCSHVNHTYRVEVKLPGPSAPSIWGPSLLLVSYNIGLGNALDFSLLLNLADLVNQPVTKKSLVYEIRIWHENTHFQNH